MGLVYFCKFVICFACCIVPSDSESCDIYVLMLIISIQINCVYYLPLIY